MNKSLRTYSLVLIGIIASLMSCKKDEDTTPTTPATQTTSTACSNSFSFLHVGDSLTYDIVILGTPYVATYTILSSPSLNVYKMQVMLSGTSTPNIRYYQGCDGWLRNDTDAAVHDTLHYMKENRVMGDSWNYYDPEYDTYNQYTVAEKNVSVATAAGTFTCDKMLFYQQGTINTDTLWWSNAVGTIKYSGTLFDYVLTWKNF